MNIQQFGSAARPPLEWIYQRYRTNPVANKLTNTGLIFGGVHLAASVVEGITGDNSIDTAIDMAAPALAGLYAINSTKGIGSDTVKEVAKILTLGGIGYVVGNEIMAHQVENGSLDGFLDQVKSGYSGILNVMGDLKNAPGSLGGILTAGGYGTFQFFKGFRR